MRIDVAHHGAPLTAPTSTGDLRVLEVVSGFPKLSETFVVDQIIGLEDRGAEVEIWALDDPREDTIADDVRERELLRRTRYLRLPERAHDVDDWLRSFDRDNAVTPTDLIGYDVVHVNFGPVYLGLAPLLESTDVPVVVSFYGYDLASFVAAAGPDVYRPMFDRIDAATAVSEAGRRRLVELGCAPERAHVQRAGVHVAADPVPRGARPDGPAEVLVVARLVEKKGVDDAIRAVAAMRRPARLRIIGDGPLRGELEGLSSELGVDDAVTFEGNRSRHEVDRALSNADVVLQLSRTASDGDQEGIPVALVMAAAAGLPIVSTHHSGIPELISHGASGLLVAERDVAAAAAELDRVVGDLSLAARLGRGARATVVRDFDQRHLDDVLFARLRSVARTPSPAHVASGRDASSIRRAAVDALRPATGECPVCDGLVTFARSGDDDRCPSCGTSSSARTVTRFLLQRSDALAGAGTVLTIDPEPRIACELDALLGARHVSIGADARGPADLDGCCDLVILRSPGPTLDPTTTRKLAPGGWIVVPVTGPDAPERAAMLRDAGLATAHHDATELWTTEELARCGLDAGKTLLIGARPASDRRGAATCRRLPSVAVGVAVGRDHDGAKRSVRSVLEQGRPASEVAAGVGPATPDHIVDELASDPRIRVVRCPTDDPAEQAGAIRAALTADVELVLDAGDELTDRAIEAVVRAFDRSPDADAVIGDEVIGAGAEPIIRCEPYHRSERPGPGPSFVRRGRDPLVVRHAGSTIVVRARAGVPPPPAPHPQRTLRIVLRHNPDKAGPIVNALRDAGHELVDLGADGDVLLTDLYPSHGQIWAAMERVGRTIVYPHGAWPTLHCDGIYPVHRSIEAYFVVGDGCREVMEAIGFEPPVIPVGWPFGALREMRATPGKRVLFAAHHPDRLGHLDRRQQRDNARIVDELVDGGFEVTVRHIGTMRENGLRRRSGVEYHLAGMRSATVTRPTELDLDVADVVVSAGTFAHRAIAEGVPVVTCGQNEWGGDGMRPGQRVRVSRWPRYAHLLRYPYDADDDLAGAVRRAASDLGPAIEWRRRFIGEPFDAAAFVRRFEEIVG